MDTKQTAREYAENMNAVTAGTRTPDEARAINRKLRQGFSETEWMQIKARALHGMTGGKLN